MGRRRVGNVVRLIPEDILTPRQQLMYYLGQCDEGLEHVIIIGMYGESEDYLISTNCTRNTLANLSYMLRVAERDIFRETGL